ncbi:hypothetical protein [uncultured Microbulbifer sp.]|uniref:hypothetical protein n=1 Tax=uncultured Microbulbifer sp. TaxID=348147 RepID=UPI00260E4C18|nr:hypothetical protein [uncultured Microbulbifer sp.]
MRLKDVYKTQTGRYVMRMKSNLVILLGLAFLVSCGSKKYQDAMVLANVAALKVAATLNEYISENRDCPNSLEGWEVTSSGIELEYSGFGGSEQHKYPISITCKNDQSFSVVVKYNFDSGTWVTGGKGESTEISYGHFTELQTLLVPSGADNFVIAKQVVIGE